MLSVKRAAMLVALICMTACGDKPSSQTAAQKEQPRDVGIIPAAADTPTWQDVDNTYTADQIRAMRLANLQLLMTEAEAFEVLQADGWEGEPDPMQQTWQYGINQQGVYGLLPSQWQRANAWSKDTYVDEHRYRRGTFVTPFRYAEPGWSTPKVHQIQFEQSLPGEQDFATWKARLTERFGPPTSDNGETTLTWRTRYRYPSEHICMQLRRNAPDPVLSKACQAARDNPEAYVQERQQPQLIAKLRSAYISTLTLLLVEIDADKLAKAQWDVLFEAEAAKEAQRNAQEAQTHF